jgi:hypothetical protein
MANYVVIIPAVGEASLLCSHHILLTHHMRLFMGCAQTQFAFTETHVTLLWFFLLNGLIPGLLLGLAAPMKSLSPKARVLCLFLLVSSSLASLLIVAILGTILTRCVLQQAGDKGDCKLCFLHLIAATASCFTSAVDGRSTLQPWQC